MNEEDELSQDTVYEYNALGHLTHVTDPNSHARNFTYDYLGRKTSESETLSGTTITTSYAYDDRGNLLTVTDPE